ncbi:MAG: hypothetical protein C0390_08760 [Syntrophus sp. (in: bacteria)]|nr:hypothetical protein [Syntrophus sp. (in: bacteria)]
MERGFFIQIFKLPSKSVKKIFVGKFMGRDQLSKIRRGTPQNDLFKFQTGISWSGFILVEHASLQGKIKTERGGDCKSLGGLKGFHIF